MDILANKALVREYYERIVSTGAVGSIGDFISPDYREVHDGKVYPIGLQGAVAHVQGVRRTYPDLTLTVDRQIAEGDWIASLVTMRGTHLGEWMGIKPTGRPITVTAVNLDRIAGGRIIEHGGAANLLGPLLEIGAIRVAAEG